MKEIRRDLEENEMVASMMAGLRGTNMDSSNFADEGVSMRLVEVDVGEDPDDRLPLVYRPEQIDAFWSRRPVAVTTRLMQLIGVMGGFLTSVVMDFAFGKLKENEVQRAIEIRNIVTSLGPAYIKLGQALSIRPDLLSPTAMVELQKLCDKVPSFDSDVAMGLVEDELGRPWHKIFKTLTSKPIAAASLGQVYKGELMTGEEVAVKVQRPFVVETVTIDLYIIRKIGLFLKRFPQIQTDFVALLDEWAERFFEELDYVKEGQNATKFAEQMKEDLPQVVVPKTFSDYTTRRVLTTEWLNGEKLSQSKEDDVGKLVNIGVICYLKQLLQTGFFHADPHPGNLIRTPDGRLAILDFGLMSVVDDNIKYGMIEAISHLIHRDYDAIVEDFVTLDFIPKGTDLKPILPVLAKVFDQALEGGGAKNINFQELAADLAQITFDYPFRIPPYFALIIRAISVLEGIALVGNPEFAIVDEAYPYLSKRLLTDDSPRLREALRYMIYGKDDVFDAERLIDVLSAFESFKSASASARGSLDEDDTQSPHSRDPRVFQFPEMETILGPLTAGRPAARQLPLPAPAAFLPFRSSLSTQNGAFDVVNGESGEAREALKFLFSPEGTLFRSFLLDELVKSIDALSREQFRGLVTSLGLQDLMLPNLVPFAERPILPLAPEVTEHDKQVIQNIHTILSFLLGGKSLKSADDFRALLLRGGSVARDLGPVLPAVVREVLPEVSERLFSRILARLIRDVMT